MTFVDLIPNVLVLGLLALVIAKINEAVVGQVYDALYALFAVSDDWQGRINRTRFVWAVALGLVLCIVSRIPFLPEYIAEPYTYVIAGLVVGSGAGVIWDVALDTVPRDA